MNKQREFLKSQIYYAAKDDHRIVLYTLLTDNITKAEAEELLNESYIEDDGQHCTPLIVAARHGSHAVVKIIVSKFNVDLEKEGTVKFDGFVIEGASALWCAAGGGHLNIVKTLVKAGANVNHPTRTKSTPLRAACFDGRLDIVKYLAEHNADVHIANQYNNSCLMIASYKGHLDVVNMLLENHANPNEKALCGATALHFAAECGHLSIVQKLLEYNADLFCVNDTGMTPLKVAAERVRKDVVESLIENTKYPISKEDKIEALELLGASFANDKENYSLDLAYHYLEQSMNLRYSDPNNVITKILLPPVPAYEYWVETQTPEDLRIRLLGNANAIHIEALTIRERILGTSNPELPHPIIFRGAVFADLARFDRCIELWLHAIQLRQGNNINVAKDLLRFAQVFSQMLHVGVEVTFKNIEPVLECTVLELQRNKMKMGKSGPNYEPDVMLEEIESNITTTLYLITIMTMILNKSKVSNEDEFNVYKMVYKLNTIQLRNRDGQTLLHLACNAETPVDDFHISDICKFPCASTACLLIECGADVNAMDVDRNTPLHLIVNYHKPISDFTTLHTIIMKLTEAGAHIDCVNNRGETPLDSSATGVAEIILKTQSKLCLKCLAAREIKMKKIVYRGIVPEKLALFIDMHGPNL